MLNKLKKELDNKKDLNQAKILSSFFKTGKGQYGEGDIFLGIKVPIQRQIAKNYLDLSLDNLQELLNSNIHEYRLTALIILTNQFKKYHNKQKQIYDFYLNNTKNINNWDLVDVTCPTIIGNYLINKNKSILYKLANSNDLWEKRIAIVSTFAFIRKSEFQDTLKISEILLNDSHDLIHKAVGWMLREVGKRDIQTLENFLKKHYKNMPRTMLRYSIEKFPETKRKMYLKGEI